MRYVPYPSSQTPIYNNGTSYSSYGGSVPTIGSIGAMGYNTQYNYYNQYMNPFYIRQQEEARRRMLQEKQQNQIDIWKKLTKIRNDVYGYDYNEEEVINGFKESINQYKQDRYNESVMESHRNIILKCKEQFDLAQQRQEQIEREREERLNAQYNTESSKKTLYQWLHEDAQQRYMEAQYDKLIYEKHNVSNVYDSNGYKELLGIHNSSFASLNPNVTIDDMEISISLPERLRRERDIRRQQFAEAIKQGRM